MKYFLIINPRSRSERCRKKFRKILEEFKKRGWEFSYVFVSSYALIRAESEYANRHGYDAIIAVGGDGTINATINGFYDGDGKRISTARFGVLYTGTSPDFCKSFGIPLGVEKAIDVISDPHIRHIRTGRIQFRTPENTGMTETRIFACCANIGLGAGVAKDSNMIRKYTGDFAGTLIAVLWNLMATGSVRMIGSVDKVMFDMHRVMNISIGRTKYIASGIRVSEGMPDEDDRFYLLTAKNISLKTLPRLLNQVYTGRLTSLETLELKYAREVEFDSPDKSAGVEFDGDPAGILPCKAGLATDPLELMVEKVP
jgi:diacylglycerol kinase (ATP)